MSDKLATIETYKATGNEFFRNGNLSKAIYNYHCATMYIKDLTSSSDSGTNKFVQMLQQQVVPLTEEEKLQLEASSLSIFNNMTAVYVKQEKYKKAIEFATKVLQIDSNNIKALFRRGKSYLAVNDTEKAEEDLQKANSLCNGEDKAVLKELERLAFKKRQHDKQQKQFFAKCLSG